MKKNILLFVFVLLSTLTASAFSEVDGIYYNFDSETKQAMVTSGYTPYTGNVAIPATVTYNGVSYTVTSIGEFAFLGCSGLASVTIPSSVTTIGESAFNSCSGLTSMIIPNSVISIGDEAFYSCTGLTSIEIPNSVTSIGNSAFFGCSGLISMTIPNSVTSIGSSAFLYTPWYENQPDGLMYLGKVAYKYKGTMPENTSITLKEGTTAIGSQAFDGCYGLSSITIPNSVASIGEFAFNGTAWFENQPDGLVYIGKMAYQYKGIMPENTSINIEEGTTAIGNAGFYGCTGLTSITIPNSVTSIGGSAFSGCSGLTEVTIPNSVMSIGQNAFRNCSGLTSVIIPNSVTSIDKQVFGNCSSLTSVTIPSSVTSIGNSAFSDCTGLTSVNIPNSVKSIGMSAFSSCTGLTSVNIPNSVRLIGSSAFSGCTGLTTVEIPNSVTLINGRVFANCSGLASVTIPSGVIAIGYGAFMNCSGLASVTIPSGVTVIASSAFQNCSGLASVTIPNSVTNVGEKAFDGTPWYENQPDGLMYIGNIAYKYIGTMPENTSITLKDGTTAIGNRAFYNCSGLTEVTIPNGVTIIDEGAFYGCSSLTSVTIPNSVTSIGNGAFYQCYGLTSMTIPNSVRSIGLSVFYKCRELTEVTIGNSVESIGNEGFFGCSNLKKVYITDLDAWCKIKFGKANSNPLNYNPHLYLNGIEVKDLVIPNSVTSIGQYAFSGSNEITSVTIPNSVTEIGKNAFAGFIGKVYITDLDAWCKIKFESSSSNPLNWTYPLYLNGIEVKDLQIPNSVTEIGDYAFYNYYGLTSVTIPNSVKSIGNSAFYDCRKLTEVTIGNSVTSIGGSAFSGCTVLTSVTCKAKSVPSTGSSMFYNVPQSSATLYVPASALETYKATAPWSEFGSFVPIDDEPVATGITINETNFPDENFRNWILLQDYGKDGVLTEAEIADVKIIDVSDKNIQSLKGIEYFTSLTELRCGGNQLTSLDVSNNTALTMLYCYGNQLTSLDVSNNTALKALSCLGNQLTSFDISKNTELTGLYCQSNQLTSLDISKNTKLKGLYCYNNQLTSLDVSKNTELIGMYCYSNQIYGTAMDALVASLPNIVSEYIPGSGDADGTMRVIYDENEGNVITTTQVAAAKAKGWIPQYFNGKYWLNYDGSEPTPKEKCATPTINYEDDKLSFSCETEGVEFVYDVTCADAAKGSGETVSLTKTYTVSVYAKKLGYVNSDVVTEEINVGGGSGSISKKGDVNEDGTVNGTDIQEVINIIVNAE